MKAPATKKQTFDFHSVKKLMLWMNSGCNARCLTCDIWKERTGNNLTADEIDGWSTDWKNHGVQTVVLCGEPLMHPEIELILKILHRKNFNVELLTNGILLKKFAQSVSVFCNAVRVSLDGPEHLHNRSRGIETAFAKLKAGVAELLRFKADCDVTARCAINLQNYSSLTQTVRAARDIGTKGISFSATDLFNEEAFRRFGQIDDGYIGKFLLTSDNIADLRKHLQSFIADCHDDFRTGFIIDTPAELTDNVLEYYQAIDEKRNRAGLKCNSPWTSMVIDYDGSIRPCFPFSSYGNIRDFDNLSAAMNCPEIQIIRERLDVSSCKTCQKCVDQTTN